MNTRKCPLCKSGEYEELVKVDPLWFSKRNPTIGDEKLENSGLLDLPHFPIVKCRKCKFVYTNRTLDAKSSEIFWNEVFDAAKSEEKIHKKYKKLRNLSIWNNLYQHYLSTTSNQSVVNVFEFGCGWGDFLLTAKSLDVHCTGVEIDPNKIAFCKMNGIEIFMSLDEIMSKRRFQIFNGDQVFEHLEDPNGIFNKIKHHLADDFVGFFSVPDYSEKKLKASIRNSIKGKAYDKNLIPWDHLNYFSASSAYSFIRDLGFEPFDVKNGRALAQKKLKEPTFYFRYKR